MSQKKISSIKASTVKSDPITTPIVRKEKEPNIDIEQKWVPFFQDSNNIYVNDLAKRARRSSTHGSIINQKITFIKGKEFTFKQNGENVSYSDLPIDFQEWCKEVNPEGESLYDVFCDLIQSYVITGNAYPHIVKSGDFTALYCYDATTVRKGKRKDIAYLSNFWRDIELSTTPSMQYPVNELEFYNNTNQQEFLIHVMRKYPEFNFYGLPDYVGALDWIDIEYRMSKYNIDKFDNGFFPSVLIQMFGEVPDGMNAQQYVEKIKDKFTGEANNDKFLVELLDSPEQAASIKEFDRERDGEFMELSTLCTKAIISAHRITPSLAGIETAGKLGSNQQIKDEYDKFMNSVVIPDFQEPLLKVLNTIIKRDTKYSDIEVGILNVSPVGDSAKVDLNAVITINEARKMLGMHMLEDARGEQFVNENAVQNIDENIDDEIENEINNTYQNSIYSKTYADYPDSAVNNAKRGIKLNKEVNNRCATNVGKQRAQDISNRRGLSFSTIKRTFSYLSRAEEYYDPSDTKACGTISYLLWGGKSMKSWAESKIKEIENS
mgnify:FL=1|tara:strand:+ start:13368 stop:15014 length:1647 start_codon:yes stop_codon:yes gene_type:complete